MRRHWRILNHYLIAIALYNRLAVNVVLVVRLRFERLGKGKLIVFYIIIFTAELKIEMRSELARFHKAGSANVFYFSYGNPLVKQKSKPAQNVFAHSVG